uniref:AP2/ERF domain-containing protein n=1 Tax=Micromonas pusilla TaxID=38833 RepID=A0A7S0PLS4_MICPS|mmetsp:Transcript_1234/g.4612  ORF Transcript_1234/g.4612 Transcript_1234/m.4612 type:complete len:249 (+) Transcript_1234:90-836(+)
MFGERWFQNGAEAGTSETAREPSERRNVRYLQTHKFVGITRRLEGDKRSCALRPWRAQVNHAGKAYRAPGSFSTAEDAARAYDELVRTLGLTGSKRVNFPQNDGERAYVRSDKKVGGKRASAKKVEDDPIVAPRATYTDANDGSRGRGRGRGRGAAATATGARSIPAAAVAERRGRGQSAAGAGDDAPAETDAPSDSLELRLSTLKSLYEKGLMDEEEYTDGKRRCIEAFALGSGGGGFHGQRRDRTR